MSALRTTLTASTLLLLLLLGSGIPTAQAQSSDCVGVALTAIPSCAQSCFLNGAPSVGCGGTDFACQCGQEARLYAAIEGCVASGCPAASFQAVIDGASSVCLCAVGPTSAGGGGGTTVSGSFVILGTVTAAGPAALSPASAVSSPTTTAGTVGSSIGGGGSLVGSGSQTSAGAGAGGGSPIPVPAVPAITLATGASSSGAERGFSLHASLAGGAVAAAVWVVLAL